MYEFPYGAGQQLNLNWIINEIITLHKQLDPDWDLPNFDTAFPYTNLNTLNLDWILRELKAIKDLAPTEDAQLLKMVANALIANTYDAETQYNVDDIVYRDSDNRLYKCITATPAGGEPFDSNKWVEVDVGGVLTDLLNSVVTPPEPYDGNPAMDGTASAGTSTQYARGDHVHPKDTARVPTSRTVNGKALSGNIIINASEIPNDSNVTGENVDDALNTLNGAITSEATTRGNADTALQNAINVITPLDTAPTKNSTKGITSGAVYDGIIAFDPTATYGTVSDKYTLRCFGWVSNSGKDLILCCPIGFYVPANTALALSNITVNINSVSGLVALNETQSANYLISATLYSFGRGIYFTFRNSNGFGITNRTPLVAEINTIFAKA